MVKTKVTGKSDKFISQESNHSQSEEEEYEVQDILKKKIIKGGEVQYLVKWKGYSLQHCTWEPAENLMNVWDKIVNFEETVNLEEEDSKQDSNIKIQKKIKEKLLSEDDELKSDSELKSKNQLKITKEQSKNSKQQEKIKKNPKQEKQDEFKKNDRKQDIEDIENQSRILKKNKNNNDINEPKNSQKNNQEEGSFSKNDVVDRLKHLNPEHMPLTEEFQFSISWKVRPNGVKPSETFITYDELKRQSPFHALAFWEDSFIINQRENNDNNV